jgi:hypothetical protein
MNIESLISGNQVVDGQCKKNKKVRNKSHKKSLNEFSSVTLIEILQGNLEISINWFEVLSSLCSDGLSVLRSRKSKIMKGT